MSKIQKMQKFYEWFYEKVQNIHTINNVEFENILEKL